MASWGNPYTILSGLIAMLFLSSVIVLREKVSQNDENDQPWLLFALTAGGLAATILFACLILIQMVLSMVK